MSFFITAGAGSYKSGSSYNQSGGQLGQMTNNVISPGVNTSSRFKAGKFGQ